MNFIDNIFTCIGTIGFIYIILPILVMTYAIFYIPIGNARIQVEKEMFKKKYKKEIFEELDNFTDEEREKLLFLIKEKIKEKKENAKDFFNDK